MTDRNRKHLIVAALVLVVLAVLDWATTDVGVTKPIVVGVGSVEVVSSADGAEVLIDGAVQGTTPLAALRLLSGTYTLQVRHRFHPPYVGEIEVRRGVDQRVAVDLEIAYGALAIATNPRDAVITLDGERLDERTPMTLEDLTAGEYEVVLEIFGRRPVRQTVAVLPGERVEVVAELERLASSELTVRPDPRNAVVRLLETPVDYRPEVRLPVGEYLIEVSAPGYATKLQSHRLRKGVNVIDVTLTRERGLLTVNVEPRDARVSIRLGTSATITEYEEGARLPTGPVEVRVQKAGYRTVLEQVILGKGGRTVQVNLERFRVAAGQTLRDELDLGIHGPWVVVLPTGRAEIGEADGDGVTALPRRTVEITQPFAMGVTEVTRGEFYQYVQAVGGDMPKVKGMDTDEHPIANVRWREAVAYTQWLTERTGNVYRLPSEEEWAYAAHKGGAGGDVCELGNTADRSLREVFREWQFSDCDDGFPRSAPVASFRASEVGLYDLVGNVREWVSDCGVSGCDSHIARGSAWNSVGEDLRSTFRESYHRHADTRGFRVVREL